MTVPVRRRLESSKDIERHFFRHLDNARELRHNPLVSRLFERVTSMGRPEAYRRVAVEIREAVRDGAREILSDPGLTPLRSQRLHQIIIRCDLEGAAHKVVAADLGLCDRQFYRERAEATRRVTERVRVWAERTALGNARVADVFSLELNRVNVLRQSAHFEGAANQIERVTKAVPAGVRRALALSQAAELRAELHAFDDARRNVGEAFEHIRGDADSADGDRQEALATAFLSSAVLAEAEGDFSQVDTLCERVHEHARAALAFGGRDAARTLQARASLLQATQSDGRGDAAKAAHHLSSARDSMEKSDHAPPATMAEYLRRSLDHHTLHGSDNQTVVEAYARSLEVIEQNGMLVEASRAISSYAAYLSLQGQIDEARSHLFECLSMNSLVESQAYTDLLLAAADVESSENGNPAAAIQLAERARARLAPHTFNWANTHLIEAMARLTRKDYAGVVQPISRALETFQSLSVDRYAGGARRILAQAYHGLGRNAEAKALIGDAIDQLRDRANSRQLYLAYNASAAITGSRAHALEARRLQKVM